MRKPISRRVSRARVTTAARSAAPLVLIEPVERRTMMSAAVLSNGVLTVTGTSAADTIAVNYTVDIGSSSTYSFKVTENGVSQTFTAPVTKLVVNAGDGNDSVSVQGSTTDDTSGPIAPMPVSVDGGAGDDAISVYLDDEGQFTNPAAATVSITADDGNDVINYVGDPNATLDGGAGNDDIQASAEFHVSNATLNGGDGNDTLEGFGGGVSGYDDNDMIGGAGNDTFELHDPDSFATVSGGDGTDQILLTDGDPSTYIDLTGQTKGPNWDVNPDVENVVGQYDSESLEVIGNASDNDIAVSGSGTETLIGGAGNDTLSAAGGDATTTLSGGDGNDTLVPSNGQNTFSGGAGTADVVDYSARTANLTVYLDGSQPSGDPAATVFNYTTNASQTGDHDYFDGTVERVYSGSGNDLLVADPAGGDALYGNGGNDTLVAQGGADALFGGNGNDQVQAADNGATYIDGGPGTDAATVDASGDTTINVEAVTKVALPAVLSNGVLTVTGTAGADTINVQVQSTGTAGQTEADVTVNGLKQTFTATIAHVVVNAGDGNDSVDVDTSSAYAGMPDTSVSGGAGNDNLHFDVGDGNVTLDGGAGDDNLYASGSDTAYVTMLGGAGNDSIDADLDAEASINGGDGNDTIELSNINTPQTVVGGAGVDTVTVQPDNPGDLTINLDGQSDSVLPGGNRSEFGSDIENLTVDADDNPVSVTGDALDNVINVGSQGGDATVHGGAGNDTITADVGGSAQLFGDAGNDRLDAAQTAGNVTLSGGDGNDTLVPGAQPVAEQITGGAGTDLVDYSARTDDLVIDLGGAKLSGDAADPTDTFDGTVENAAGGSGDDVIYGTVANNVLAGNAGNDTLVSNGGADSLSGGAGNDTFNAADQSPTTIDGGTGIDAATIDSTGDATTNVETVTKVGGATKLTGTVIGTTGSNRNSGNTIANAVDGSLSTYFDAATANGNTVGYDLGTPATISGVSYAPRSGFASRMVGGVFQGSTSPQFTTGVVDLYTITATPATGHLTTAAVAATGSFRYVRYLSPNGSFGNAAEVQFNGTPGKAGAVAVPLTGTTIGTPGSYKGDGNTIANATDGNLNTFFDGPTANGNFVGLDLGTQQTIDQVRFAPRHGYESRMVGGVFQASTSADFSTGVTTLYTVTPVPKSGILTDVPTNKVTARYVRYLSPDGSEGDVAEVQFLE